MILDSENKWLEEIFTVFEGSCLKVVKLCFQKFASDIICSVLMVFFLCKYSLTERNSLGCDSSCGSLLIIALVC